MTYVVEEEGELAHYGVPGMKWGVRRERESGGSSSSGGSKSSGSSNKSGGSSKPASSAAPKKVPKLTPAQRQEIGKKVAFAVVASAGGIAVSALAGPIAGAAVGAGLRGAFAVTSSSKYHDDLRTNGSDGKMDMELVGKTSKGEDIWRNTKTGTETVGTPNSIGDMLDAATR